MLRKFYDWTLALAETPYALSALAVISFLESSIFPIPPDLLLIPMVLATPHRAFKIAAICTIASVLGGLFGYLIGSGLFEQVGRPILEFYGKEHAFESFAERFNTQGAWVVLFAGITPFPYKVITIASGATGLSLPVFIIASIVARSLRFFIIAALLWKFGPPIRDFIERRFGLVATAAFVLLVGGFFLVRFI